MALLITEDCINCDLCSIECPNEAIEMGDDIFEIDSKKCTECVGHYDEPSCVAVCPVDCIQPNPNCSENSGQLAEKFIRLHS